MFEKFTDKARKVMSLAQDEARNLGQMYVGTEHLLLALIREGEGVAAQALAKLDVTYDETLATVRSLTASESELPSPEWIRDNISRNNESDMFLDILQNRLSGRHFGNVISFGDNDSPYYEGYSFWRKMPGEEFDRKMDSAGFTIQVDRVMHYHTYLDDTETGYARWVVRANPNVEQVFDTSWCDMMVR